MRKKGRTKKIISASIDRDLALFIDTLPVNSKSTYINDAVREKQLREKTPELKIKEIRNLKKTLAIQITKLTDEEEKIKEKLRWK